MALTHAVNKFDPGRDVEAKEAVRCIFVSKEDQRDSQLNGLYPTTGGQYRAERVEAWSRSNVPVSRGPRFHFKVHLV